MFQRGRGGWTDGRPARRFPITLCIIHHHQSERERDSTVNSDTSQQLLKNTLADVSFLISFSLKLVPVFHLDIYASTFLLFFSLTLSTYQVFFPLLLLNETRIHRYENKKIYIYIQATKYNIKAHSAACHHSPLPHPITPYNYIPGTAR